MGSSNSILIKSYKVEVSKVATVIASHINFQQTRLFSLDLNFRLETTKRADFLLFCLNKI